VSSVRPLLLATGLLLACGPGEDVTEERYAGELVERCAAGVGQTRGTRPGFELVLTTDDEIHYETNIPICHPDATLIEPGRLKLSESACFLDGDDVIEGDHHLAEGQIVFDGDSASVLYRWRVSGPEGTRANCEVDNVLLRTE